MLRGLFLDRFGGVDPPAEPQLVRVLQPEVVGLHDVQLGEHALQQVRTQRSALDTGIELGVLESALSAYPGILLVRVLLPLTSPLQR